MKKIQTYKIDFDGNSDISRYQKKLVYESYEEAKKLVEYAWAAYKPHFMKLEGREIIYEYIRDDKDNRGYLHQIVVTYKGFANIINLAVRPSLIVINWSK